MLKMPKDQFESYDSFWTASLSYALLEAYSTGAIMAPDDCNSGIYNNMYVWIELADEAQYASLPEFPVQEYA